MRVWSVECRQAGFQACEGRHQVSVLRRGGANSASVSRQSKQSKVAAAPKTRFMLAEVERKRLTDLAIKQQSQREGDTERNGKANNFRSNEDFLERVRWFVLTCRERMADESTGGEVPKSIKENARSVLEQWCESLNEISDET